MVRGPFASYCGAGDIADSSGTKFYLRFVRKNANVGFRGVSYNGKVTITMSDSDVVVASISSTLSLLVSTGCRTNAGCVIISGGGVVRSFFVLDDNLTKRVLRGFVGCNKGVTVCKSFSRCADGPLGSFVFRDGGKGSIFFITAGRRTVRGVDRDV